jgi:hypothetical protein
MDDEISSEEIDMGNKKIIIERSNRLNEKDKLYKFQKHYFIKDYYDQMMKEEFKISDEELQKEKEYLKQCEIAEEKLAKNKTLTYQDIHMLIKRNYMMFDDINKKQIKYIQNINRGYSVCSLLFTFLSCSFMRTSVLFFNFRNSRKTLSYLIISTFGVTLYFSLQNLINKHYVKYLGAFPLLIKDKILNEDNRHLKVPYGENEKTFKPEVEITDVFKI